MLPPGGLRPLALSKAARLGNSLSAHSDADPSVGCSMSISLSHPLGLLGLFTSVRTSWALHLLGLLGLAHPLGLLGLSHLLGLPGLRIC